MDLSNENWVEQVYVMRQSGYNGNAMQSLRIGFDARYAGDHFPGIGRYITSLLPELSHLTGQHRLFVFTNTGQTLPTLTDTHVEFIPVRSAPFALTQQFDYRSLPAGYALISSIRPTLSNRTCFPASQW